MKHHHVEVMLTLQMLNREYAEIHMGIFGSVSFPYDHSVYGHHQMRFVVQLEEGAERPRQKVVHHGWEFVFVVGISVVRYFSQCEVVAPDVPEFEFDFFVAFSCCDCW